MIIPVRCYTCNQVLADRWLEYKKMVDAPPVQPVEARNDETTPKPSPQLQAFETLNIRRDCCRRHFLGHVELVEII